MKIFFLFFLSLTIFGFSQTKVDLIKRRDSLTLKFQKEQTDSIQRKLNLDKIIEEFSTKDQKERCAFFGVSQIQNIDADIIYRFWNTNNMLEIKSEKGKVTGKIIYAVKNVQHHEQFFRKTFILSSEDAEFVYKVFSAKYGSLKELNWESGFDGSSYIYERKNWNIFKLNSYHTCCNDLNEAKFYLEMNRKITSSINYEKYFQIFEKEIPFRSFTYYGVAYTILKFKK